MQFLVMLREFCRLLLGILIILSNCEASYDGLLNALSLGHGSYQDFLSYFFPKGFFSGLRITEVVSLQAVAYLC